MTQKPEYCFTITLTDIQFALHFLNDSKVFGMLYNTNIYYENFMNHLPELQNVYESLIDEDSKKTFCGYWEYYISNQMNKLVFANTPQYICAGFTPKVGDVFIDCGVCDGGTSLRFSKMGCKVYGFEMDKLNYEKAAKLADENGFTVENLGVGSFNHDVKYIQGGSGSHISAQGNGTAKIITLDSYIFDHKIEKVDFIKFDVEGAELDVLKGAAYTITRFKPILAVSVYHKPDDFWTLMNFIKSIRPDYEFAMRQYAISRDDGAQLFANNTEEFFDSYGMDVKFFTHWECDLFAR